MQIKGLCLAVVGYSLLVHPLLGAPRPTPAAPMASARAQTPERTSVTFYRVASVTWNSSANGWDVVLDELALPSSPAGGTLSFTISRTFTATWRKADFSGTKFFDVDDSSEPPPSEAIENMANKFIKIIDTYQEPPQQSRQPVSLHRECCIVGIVYDRVYSSSCN